MRILVTGGAGFIGSHIAEYFLKQGDEVVVLDNLSSGKEENIPKGAQFIQGSVTNTEDIEKAMKDIDNVFHLAAMVSVPLSFENPSECLKINVEGTRKVLQSALDNGVKKVMLSSSAAVYGDNPNTPLKEDEPYAPMSPYAESKVEGEKLCQEFSKKGLKTCSLRYFNVYGPRQDPKSPYSGVISIFVDRANDGLDITINGDGTQTRDFIYVADVVAANVLAMEKGEGVFNVATGKEITIKELAQKIIIISNSSSKILLGNPREGDIKKSVANIDKISELGFKIVTDLNEGLKTLLIEGV